MNILGGGFRAAKIRAACSGAVFWGKAVEGHRSPRRCRAVRWQTVNAERLGVRQSAGALRGDRRPRTRDKILLMFSQRENFHLVGPDFLKTMDTQKNIGNPRFAACMGGARLALFFPKAAARRTANVSRFSFSFCSDFPPVSKTKNILTRCGIFRGKVSRAKNSTTKTHTSLKGRICATHHE